MQKITGQTSAAALHRKPHFLFPFSHVVRLCRDSRVQRVLNGTCVITFSTICSSAACHSLSEIYCIERFQSSNYRNNWSCHGFRHSWLSSLISLLPKHFHLRSGSPQHTSISCQDNNTSGQASFFHICTLLCFAKLQHDQELCVFKHRKRCACFQYITGRLYYASTGNQTVVCVKKTIGSGPLGPALSTSPAAHGQSIKCGV